MPDEAIERSSAEMENTSVFRELARDGRNAVRRSVARNPNCPEGLLRELAEDGDHYVRECVAENPNCPMDVLEQLAHDEDRYVRQTALENRRRLGHVAGRSLAAC
ncbi:MAG: hypothetical protein QXP84_07265 [Candidatus Korarchaeum sp.]